MTDLLNREIPWTKGRKLSLSLPRRFMGDLLHFSRRVPSVPMERRMLPFSAPSDLDSEVSSLVGMPTEAASETR